MNRTMISLGLVLSACSKTAVDPAPGAAKVPGQRRTVSSSELQASPTNETDSTHARSWITFWKLKGTPSTARITERIEEQEGDAARVSLSYHSATAGRRLAISLSGGASPKTVSLPKDGSLTVSEADGRTWEAMSGTARIEPSDGQVVLKLESIVLNNEDAPALEPESGIVRGRLVRECYILPESDRPRAREASGATGRRVATRFDPKWSSPFCAKYK